MVVIPRTEEYREACIASQHVVLSFPCCHHSTIRQMRVSSFFLKKTKKYILFQPAKHMYGRQEREYIHNLTILMSVQHIFSYSKSQVCIQGLLLNLHLDVSKLVSCGHKTVFCKTGEAKWFSALLSLVTQTKLFSTFDVHS